MKTIDLLKANHQIQDKVSCILYNNIKLRELGKNINVLKIQTDLQLKSLFLKEITLYNITTQLTSDVLLPCGITCQTLETITQNII